MGCSLSRSAKGTEGAVLSGEGNALDLRSKGAI